MSQFVVAVFADEATAENGNSAVNALGQSGMTIYQLVLLHKSLEGRISILERVDEGSAPAAVSALIGALAGLPVGLEAAMAGAAAGLLFGVAAVLTHRDVANRTLQKISQELALNKYAIFAEIGSRDLAVFEACLKGLQANISFPGGTLDKVERFGARGAPHR